MLYIYQIYQLLICAKLSQVLSIFVRSLHRVRISYIIAKHFEWTLPRPLQGMEQLDPLDLLVFNTTGEWPQINLRGQMEFRKDFRLILADVIAAHSPFLITWHKRTFESFSSKSPKGYSRTVSFQISHTWSKWCITSKCQGGLRDAIRGSPSGRFWGTGKGLTVILFLKWCQLARWQ